MRIFLSVIALLALASGARADDPPHFPSPFIMTLNDKVAVYYPTSDPNCGDSSLFVGSGGQSLICEPSPAKDGRYNTATGVRALTFIERGMYNTFTGYEAGENVVDNDNNSGFGEATQIYNRDGDGNSSLGWKTIMGDAPVNGGLPTSPGNWLTAIGAGAGITITNSNNTIMMGRYAIGGADATGNDYDIVIGDAAGFDMIDADRNIFIATSGGRGVVDGDGNVLIGCNNTTSGVSASMDNIVMFCDGYGKLRIKISGDTLTFYKLNGDAVPVVP